MRYSKEEVWEVLKENSTKLPNGCLIWNRGKWSNGYGCWRHYKTHRLAAWIYGSLKSLDSREEVLHRNICLSKACLSEEHLYIGTPADNARDLLEKGNHRNQRKTHCKNGHPLSGDNLILEKKGTRRCRICTNKWQRKSARYERKLAREKKNELG